MFARNRITMGKSTMEGDNSYADTRIVDFPEYNYVGNFYYNIAFLVGISTMKKHHSIFRLGATL